MDEDDNAQARRRQDKARSRLPQYKYKDTLQKLADRKVNEIVIDLDDLTTVRRIFLFAPSRPVTDPSLDSTSSKSTRGCD
jgi:hypothetical protein